MEPELSKQLLSNGSTERNNNNVRDGTGNSNDMTSKEIPGQSQGKVVGNTPQFNRFGQHEPAVVRIKNIISQYVGEVKGYGLDEIVKELIQNADDAKATEVQFVLDKRSLQNNQVWDEWKTLQGPALCVYNNQIFTQDDIESIQKLGVGSKGSNPDKTGQFGIGFNVVYQLTDCPVLLSDGTDVCMFDPHLRYVPGANDERPGGHVNLQTDPDFKIMWKDFMQGFLPEYFNQTGGTVFRFPLRNKILKSDICKVTYGDKDLDEMEHHLQSFDFRMFLHNAILFTKNIETVTISAIQQDGELEQLCCIRRRIEDKEKQQLKNAFQKVSREMKALMSGKISGNDVSRFTLLYNLKTEDEYNTHEWFASQTFGFHKDLTEEDDKFLREYFKDGSKKFLPVGGIAGRTSNLSSFKGVVYCFLQLPISTGLPVHINGHFAIHSSRRTIWTNTTFGSWNCMLRDHVLIPAYCNFLQSLSKKTTHSNMKIYLDLMPDVKKTNDPFFSELAVGIYTSMMRDNLSLIPVTGSTKTLSFTDPEDVYFTTQQRNEVIENILINLGNKICCYPELSWKLKMAGIREIKHISPDVVKMCLKFSAEKLSLPKKVEDTPFENANNITLLLEYCLNGNDNPAEYTRLVGVPLCLTSDGMLRIFDDKIPVIVTVGFSVLLPEHPHLILHKDICHLFTVTHHTVPHMPVKKLTTGDLARYISKDSSYITDPKWYKLFWAFVKRHASKGLKPDELLRPLEEMPLLPSTDGVLVKLSEGKSLLNIHNTSKMMQAIILKMGVAVVDLQQLTTSNVAEKDISEYIHSFVLDALLPEDLLSILAKHDPKLPEFRSDECEALLQYFNIDSEVVNKSTENNESFRKLPIFETIENEYRSLPQGSLAIVLDNCIPTRGISTWMEQSNYILLKEKSAYQPLYNALGLSKKNVIDVYLKDILPNFSKLDDELRLSHLLSIRDNIIPILPTFGTQDLSDAFWNQIKALPFIRCGDQFHCACDFYAPEIAIVELLGRFLPLPDVFQEAEWKDWLKDAGLKTTLSGAEIIECALQIAQTENKENHAQTLLKIAINTDLDDDIWLKFAEVKFIPQCPIEAEEDLLNICPSVVPMDELICLKGTVVFENLKKRQLFRHSILVWSVVASLPKWVEIPTDKQELLGIEITPKVEDVCTHCIQLCESMTEHLPEKAFQAFKKIIYYIFDFLQSPCSCNKKGCSDCKGLRELSKIACIPLKGGKRRIKPPQLIVHFPKDIDADVLHPYVYARPQEMSKHDELLKRIGSYGVPVPDVYAEVLYRIRQEIGNAPLQANQKQTASMAVCGLFTSLTKESTKTVNVRPLYLPSEKAVMTLSTELIANDNESIAKTVRDRNYDYLCKLTTCNLTRAPKEYLIFLPEDIRSKCLTEVVVQNVRIDAECEAGENCEYVRSYKQHLHSKSFWNALWLMARVPEKDRVNFKEDLNRLKILDVECCAAMATYLSEKGRTMENTEREESVFLTNEMSKCKLLLQHADEYPGASEQVTKMAKAVKSIICFNENYFIDSGLLIKLIKCETDDEVEEFLIEEGISAKKDDMSAPNPGTTVPELDQTLFSDNPDVRLKPKEYVGYMKPNKKGESELVFARVIRESTVKNKDMTGPDMFREYDIDIGLGFPITVQSLDLFREVKRQTLQQNKQIVAAHVTNPMLSSKADSATVQEAKRTVTKLIEDVYSDPNRVNEREKLKKRLCLKWHPDKAGNEELAKQIFQHLTMEFERLADKYAKLATEDEAPDDEQMYEWESTEEQKCLADGPDKTEEEIAEEEAKKKEEEEMEQKRRTETATKWVKQGLKDLACAQLLQESGGFEWACNLCHEVVRKILVASLIFHKCLTLELESSRLLVKLADVVSKIENAPNTLMIDVSELRKLKVDVSLSREPGMYEGKIIPSDVYSEDMADKAVEITESIVSCMLDFLSLEGVE